MLIRNVVYYKAFVNLRQTFYISLYKFYVYRKVEYRYKEITHEVILKVLQNIHFETLISNWLPGISFRTFPLEPTYM